MTKFENLAWLHRKPQGSGLLKANPECFMVVEDLGFMHGWRRRAYSAAYFENGCNTHFWCAGEIPENLRSRSQLCWVKRYKHAVTEQ